MSAFEKIRGALVVLRRRLLTQPIMRTMQRRKLLPVISATERAADTARDDAVQVDSFAPAGPSNAARPVHTDDEEGALLRFPATFADLVTTDPVGGGSAS